MNAGRREDVRLLSGQGRYLADHLGPETLHAGFVRTPVASGRIETLDVAPALEVPGVRAVFTAADLDAAGIGPLAHEPLPQAQGAEPREYPQPILSRDVVRHLGEPVALVVADSAGALADGVEAVTLEVAAGDPPAGIAFSRDAGDAEAAAQAIADAAHRVTVEIDVPRVTAFPLEPRGAIASWRGERLQYRASTQNPFALRGQIAKLFGWQEAQVHVVAADVGGSFGLKGYMTREDAALVFAAHALGAELAWVSTRSEAFLSDAQGRGVTGSVTLGLNEDLTIAGLLAELEIDVGAYPGRRSFGVMNNINGITGMYRIPHVGARIAGRLSARAPLAPFRGNGRPEATHAIERVLDKAARALGADPMALRRANLIGPAEMPCTTGLGTQIDCGDFPRVMETALGLAKGVEARRAEAESRGRLHGFGLANCIESAGGPLRAPKPDYARLTVDAEGRVRLAPGVMSVGQGHETGLTRMVAERLEIDADRIDYAHGDTQAITHGRGSGGSSGLTVAGSALSLALDELLAEGRAEAARALDCDESALSYRDGAFQQTGGNESLSLAEIAARRPDGAWQVESVFIPPAATFPNGTHICEVEIDPETGAVEITRYAAVEDVGRVLNPVLVEGQLQGGIAQGLSLGLGERMVFDESGQILTGSLMDYQMARAVDLPSFELGNVEVPTELNPLGVKGVGEAGAVGATAALISAVGDALCRAGVEDFEMPATPARVWEALNRAGHLA